jgi:O-antigen/teichoic acid export membrane protein
MFKQFFKDSAVYGVTTILARGLSLILLPLYTRVLSPTDYGTVDILTIFTSLVNLTVALEISQAVARYFTDAQTETDKVAYASTSLWFTCGAYGLFVIIAFLASTSLSQRLLESSHQVDVFRVALLSIFGFGLFYLAQNQLRWQLQPALYAISSLVFTLVTVSASVIFVWILRWGVIGVIYGQLTGNFVGAATALYFARRSYQLTFDWDKCKEMLRFSAPLVPSSVGVFITLYIDRIAIKQMMTIADVGLFGVGYRLASLVSLLMVGVQSAITPLVLNHYRDRNTPTEIARIFHYFAGGALLLCLILSLFAREILFIFTTPEYYPASAVVSLLAPAVLLSGMYVFAPGLSIAKKTGTIGTINIIGAMLNTTLNFLLIPILGIQGAALATLLSAATLFSIYMFYSQKFYFVPHPWRRLSLAIIITLAAYFIGTQVNLTWGIDIVVKFALICLVGSIFIWLGLVEFVAIKRLWARVTQLQVFVKA